MGVKVLDFEAQPVAFSNAAFDLKRTANVFDVPVAGPPAAVGYLQVSGADLVLDLETWGTRKL